MLRLRVVLRGVQVYFTGVEVALRDVGIAFVRVGVTFAWLPTPSCRLQVCSADVGVASRAGAGGSAHLKVVLAGLPMGFAGVGFVLPPLQRELARRGIDCPAPHVFSPGLGVLFARLQASFAAK